MALLEIKNLSVAFGSAKSCFHAVEGVSLSVDPGEVLGVVGESGSGKSVTMMAVMGLLDAQARITADTLRFNGQPLLQLPLVWIFFPVVIQTNLANSHHSGQFRPGGQDIIFPGGHLNCFFWMDTNTGKNTVIGFCQFYGLLRRIQRIPHIDQTRHTSGPRPLDNFFFLTVKFRIIQVGMRVDQLNHLTTAPTGISTDKSFISLP